MVKLGLEIFSYGKIRVRDLSPIVKLRFEIFPYDKIIV